MPLKELSQDRPFKEIPTVFQTRVAEPYYYDAALAPEPVIFIAAPAPTYIILYAIMHVFAKGCTNKKFPLIPVLCDRVLHVR